MCDERSSKQKGLRTNGLCSVGCPVVNLIHLDDHMVSLKQNIRTKQAISCKMIHTMLDPHVSKDMRHSHLVRGVAGGLHVRHESLDSKSEFKSAQHCVVKQVCGLLHQGAPVHGIVYAVMTRHRYLY